MDERKVFKIISISSTDIPPQVSMTFQLTPSDWKKFERSGILRDLLDFLQGPDTQESLNVLHTLRD